MASKYLNEMSTQDYDKLTKKLLEIQTDTCYICQKVIDLKIHTTNIDHITPLVNGGKDSEENFAVTHESCNKSKQDSNLNIARILYKLREIQEDTEKTENKPATLKHILANYGGGKNEFKFKLENDKIKYAFGNEEIKSSQIFKDTISKEETFFIEAPIAYIHHDELINPRGINNTISKLVKEFDKGNPQLHLSLARIDKDKLKIFDGQHKAVAQILLGNKKLLLRVFLSPNVDRLIETNTNAGSVLRQIAFDKSIMRQLNNTLYLERINKYQEDHNLSEDNLSFSEQQIVDYFRGENINIKKQIIDTIKNGVTYSKNNKLKDYIDFEGKAKLLPISYSAFDKTFLSLFIDSKLILNTPINYKLEEGMNPRELEVNQLVKLLNIIAEELYSSKFKEEIGVFRIEKKILDGHDEGITDDHLIAYRISKEEIMFNWMQYLNKVIQSYFINIGRLCNENQLFQQEFDEQLWINITNFIKNLRELPLWKDRSMASTIFAGKNTYDYWKTIFESGKSPDGAQVLAKPLNFIDMIKNNR